ncbi:MAG TPA: D-aminoacylase [Candidatus Omnitrophota bacterium]|nr:D-aminoacylase [Candidatus Omnitrophota bacterium]
MGIKRIISTVLLTTVTLMILNPKCGYSQEKKFDLIIRNGTVYDGTGGEARHADLAILGERIAGIGDFSGVPAAKVIDARGLVVAPGFIDIHTHSDFNPFLQPGSPHKLLQGVTTEVAGNCGMSAAPLIGDMREKVFEVWQREGVAIPEHVPTWDSVGEYLEALERAGLLTNFVFLVGHGNLRWSVMKDASRKASPEESKEMEGLLRQSIAEGAFGLSLGLVYLPGTYAGKDELIGLAKTLKESDSLLTVHMRSEGRRLIESVDEVLEIAEASGTRLEISHLKAAGFKNWQKIDPALRRIEDAKQKGFEVFGDVYPYEAAFAELGVILPEEIYEAPDRVALLKNPEKRSELKRLTQKELDESGSIPEQFMIAAVKLSKHKSYEGKTLAEIAKMEGKDPLDALFDLLAEENFLVSAFSFSQDPAVVKHIAQKEYVSIGSDNMSDFGPKPHPRTYGTFPRFLQWVRDGKVVPLSDAIRKMTGLPADVLGLSDRGRIREGEYADIVIFDLAKIESPATYEDPKEYARGVEWVLVNGAVVVEQGKYNGRFAGQVLRKKGRE